MITNKTIEFIEKEINICNQNIDFQMQLAFESQTNQFKKRYHENEALKLTKKLQLLKQVKSELEAWEVVKKHLILDKEFHQIDLHLHYNTKYREDYLKLKKALEVEDANM